MNLDKLIAVAKSARENSYSPYSNYKVGAALLSKTGKIYSGCNIENSGIMAICAERVAFCKAVSEGERDFECILVLAGTDDLEFTTPCGYCRQFMTEFCDKNFKILAYVNDNDIQEFKLGDLLPHNFKL